MATLTRGITFGATEQVTNAKLHALVDNASVGGITDSDVAADAEINSDKIAFGLDNFVTLVGDQTVSGVKTFSSQPIVPDSFWSKVYPIGIVVTLGVSTNPNTLFGFGTWTQIEGRVIVGLKSTDTDFDNVNETGGAKSVTLDINQIPSHTHTIHGFGNGTGSSPWAGASDGKYISETSSSTGGGLSHENMPPYIVKYVWERTA